MSVANGRRQLMRTSRHRRLLAMFGAVLLLAVISAGCARRSTTDGATATSPVASQAADIGTAAPSPDPTSSPAATPAATAASTPAATPVATPDLSAIDGLIKDIDNELGADASAGADEGNTP